MSNLVSNLLTLSLDGATLTDPTLTDATGNGMRFLAANARNADGVAATVDRLEIRFLTNDGANYLWITATAFLMVSPGNRKMFAIMNTSGKIGQETDDVAASILVGEDVIPIVESPVESVGLKELLFNGDQLYKIPLAPLAPEATLANVIAALNLLQSNGVAGLVGF